MPVSKMLLFRYQLLIEPRPLIGPLMMVRSGQQVTAEVLERGAAELLPKIGDVDVGMLAKNAG